MTLRRATASFTLGLLFACAAACGGSTFDGVGDAGSADGAASGDGSSGGRDGSSGADGGSLVDAGGDASCPLVPIHCRQGHCTDMPPAVCQGGTWVCPQGPPSCYDDAGGTFACGPSLVCDAATQYCEQASGGPPPPPDAGNGVH